jgi:formamidopyrimidine-DNA glycosylase
VPEAPDLAVIRSFLEARLTGQEVRLARLLKPPVLRSWATEDFARDIAGRRLEAFQRRGKFLLVGLSGDRVLVINPKLTGALRYCAAGERMLKRACQALELSNGMHLRYLEDRQMGKVYYGRHDQVGAVPRLEEQGPDVLDEPLHLEEFGLRLRPFRGEVKGILTRGTLVSGIGNAYADEMLRSAGLSPLRRRTELSPEEKGRLRATVYPVPTEAVAILEDRMGDATHVNVRDFLQAHGKGGQPYPQRGNIISVIKANQRLTNYCRHCQPGMLIRN